MLAEMGADLRRHQAVHEAGHAVIGSVLGLHVDEVGFNPKPEGAAVHFPASTRFTEGDPIELIRVQPAIMVVVMFAGAVAEKVVLGDKLPYSHTGDLKALELCYPNLPEDPKPIFDPAMRQALILVKDHREEIAAVADRLIADNRLGGKDVEKIVAEVRSRQSGAGS
jgi:ATP-dependent Zn protease